MNNQPFASPINEDIIGSATSIPEIISALDKRGCPDLTPSIDFPNCGKDPYTGGGFCDVYQGQLLNGTKIAIKTLRVYDSEAESRGKVLKRAAREMYHWSKLRHPNVLPLLGLTIFRGHMSMISEWMENGDLSLYLQSNPNANKTVLCIDVGVGLAYIHESGMTHGDIKAANVMVSSEGLAMISDFGTSQGRDLTLGFTNTNQASFSVRWAAPELLRSEPSRATAAADVYAYGLTVLEVFTGKVPFDHLSEPRVLGLLSSGKGRPSRPDIGLDDNLWKILQSCWTSDPKKRPGIARVMDRLRALYPQDYATVSQRTAMSPEAHTSPPGPRTQEAQSGETTLVEEFGAGTIDGGLGTIRNVFQTLKSASGKVTIRPRYVSQARSRFTVLQRFRTNSNSPSDPDPDPDPDSDSGWVVIPLANNQSPEPTEVEAPRSRRQSQDSVQIRRSRRRSQDGVRRSRSQPQPRDRIERPRSRRQSQDGAGRPRSRRQSQDGVEQPRSRRQSQDGAGRPRSRRPSQDGAERPRSRLPSRDGLGRSRSRRQSQDRVERPRSRRQSQDRVGVDLAGPAIWTRPRHAWLDEPPPPLPRPNMR